MSRLISAMKTDVTVQVRNRLYHIGIAFSVLAGGMLALIAPTVSLAQSIPVAMLLLVGGTTLLYVVGLITFEKEEGTLSAVIVSPLRTSEYLMSKVLTLTALATLE
ncbi:MAG: fluoroquinolone transporter permease, partial [Clostridia bacterium]|nr:fluoroquinolone transporter permease [Clostridia bacterium]